MNITPDIIIFVIVVGIFLLGFFTLLLRWIWNTTLVRAATWANPIGIWDAFKLLLLALIIFGGLGVRFGH